MQRKKAGAIKDPTKQSQKGHKKWKNFTLKPKIIG